MDKAKSKQQPAVLRLLEHIRLAVSISSFAATVAYVIAQLARDPHLPAFMMAMVTGGTAFIATLILTARDSTNHKNVIRCVRPMLMAQQNMSDRQFCSHFPDRHPELLVEIRLAIGNFFTVPREKIHPMHYLGHYQLKTIEPSFHVVVVAEVFNRYRLSKSMYKFQTNESSTVLDFVEQVADVVESAAA